MQDRLVEEFREYLLEEERSPSTIRSYLYAVRLYLREIGDLSKAGMVEFKRQQIEKVSPRTAANRITALNCFCSFRGDYGSRVRSIRIQQRPTLENVITLEQFERLTSGLLEDGNLKGYWTVVFLARTGARVSEFVRLDKSCLDTGVCELWTKGKIRRIRIPDFIIRESRSYFEGVPGQLLFPNRWGRQMTTRGVAKNLARWAAKYGIPREVAHPHGFRHFFALEFIKRNKDIALLKDLLGHESVDTTAIYLRLSEEQQRDEFNRTMEEAEPHRAPELRAVSSGK